MLKSFAQQHKTTKRRKFIEPSPFYCSASLLSSATISRKSLLEQSTAKLHPK
jgi:hypothetical protein